MRHGKALRCAGLGLVLMAMGSLAWASEEGAALYRRYCANCHGPAGRGDGPDARLLARPPRNLRDGVLQLYPVEDLVARVRNGRSLPLDWDPKALAQIERETDAVLSHLRRLAHAHWPRVEQGWALYAIRCAECHGPFGRPPENLPAGVRAPRDLSSPEFQRTVRDTQLVQTIRHGRRGMPALVPRITETEGRALYSFVRLLSPGFETYQRLCAACHGDDGRGSPGPTGEAEKKPMVAFDRRYFARTPDALVRERIRHMLQQKATRMPHFAVLLDEGQARAIIEYLRGLP